MPEDNAAPSTPTTNSGQGQPASQQATDDKIVLSKEEYDTLQRHANQGRGAQAIYEAARSSGRTSLQEIVAALTPTKPSPSTPPAGAPPTGGASNPLNAPDPEAVAFSVVSKALAERDHVQAIAAQKESIRRLAIEAVGDNASDYEKEAAIALLELKADKEADLYPIGHPLHSSSLAPVSASVLSKLAEEIKTKRNTKGSAMAAAAAGTRAAPSVLGTGASAGSPVKGGQDQKAPRFSQLTRAQQEEWLQSRRPRGA